MPVLILKNSCHLCELKSQGLSQTVAHTKGPTIGRMGDGMGILYILKSAANDQIKIGVTNSEPTLRSRLSALGGSRLFDISGSFFFDCKRPRVVEQFLHFHFEENKINEKDAFVRNSGVTECFQQKITNDVLLFIKNHNLGSPIIFSLSPKKNNIRTKTTKINRIRHEEHVAEYKRQLAREKNERIYRKIETIIEQWRSGGHLLGRYQYRKEYPYWCIALHGVDYDTDLNPLKVFESMSSDFQNHLAPVLQARDKWSGSKVFDSAYYYDEYSQIAISSLLSPPDELPAINKDASIQAIKDMFLEIPVLEDLFSEKLRRHFNHR